MSDHYHTKAYPLFMQSNGPFKVYDHAEAKGPRESQKIQAINEQAAERYNDELEQIMNLKETQKHQFANAYKTHDLI